jgi:cellobiose-specific phosphotransferase system component IIB
MFGKGVSPLLTGVLYIAIVTVAVGVVVNVVTPTIKKMEDQAAFEQGKDIIASIDKVIAEVISEGKGSTRIVPIQIKKGMISIDNTSDKIEFTIDTEALLVSPNVKRKVGNLVFASNMDVDVIDNGNYITMRNSYLEVNITKNGTQTNWEYINMSNLIMGIRLIRENKNFNGNVLIKVDDVFEDGYGYVYAEEYGYKLPKGKVIAHLNTSEAEFDIVFTLNSYSDFLTIEGRNYRAY